MATWPVQDAEANLSKLIERARSEGPQTITRHGVEHAVVLSIEEYGRLLKRQPSFDDTLLSGPKDDEFALLMDAIINERSKDLGRDFNS